MKAIFRRRHDEAVYTVTDAHRPMSEDICYRERRYLITMGIRALCFLLSILFAVTLHGSGPRSETRVGPTETRGQPQVLPLSGRCYPRGPAPLQSPSLPGAPFGSP